MDIRAFFGKKPPATTASTKRSASAGSMAPAPASRTTKAESPARPRRAAAMKKKQVVVVDDSEEEDEEEVVPAKAKAKTTSRAAMPRKRLRRGAIEDDDDDEDYEDNDHHHQDEDDEEEAEMAPPAAKKPTTRTRSSPTRTTAASTTTRAAPAPATTKTIPKIQLNENADGDDGDVDVEMTMPLQIAASGKPPPPCSGALDGKTFAFTGVLQSLARDAAVHLIKQCGGTVTNSVSKATKYLVVGERLENGDDVTTSNKYRDAVHKNVRILRQNEFFNLITELAAAKQLEDLEKQKAALKTPNRSVSTKGKHKLGSSDSDALWTDKYKPTNLNDMIGNIELGKKLKQWLIDWEAVHVKHTKKIPFTTKLTENRGAKTVLLSGPPGIGKTTIATLVAKECGFECTELNASDTRSKKMLQTGLKDVLGTQAIQFGPAKNPKERVHLAKRVIIMDEVDGMSGGDRGGTAELIQLIKSSKTPIICICNDRQSQKVRSLANHSFDLRMRRPTKQQISKRLMDIGAQEGLMMEKNAIEEAADRCGNDIRQLLTQMQRWRLTTTKITYDDMVNPSSQHNKDESLRLNPFSATQQIFQRDIPFEARNEAYFVDYDMMPLMVQENYMQSIMNNRSTSDEKLEIAAVAADFIADSDIANRYVRAEQRWDLLTTQAAFNVSACVVSAGFIGHPEFSRWLGKNSTASKSKRLLSELSVRMRAHASGSREVIRMDYVPFMKEILLTKLLAGDEHIQEVIDLLDSCEISREDLTESMESFKLPGIKRHSYGELETKAKSAFTRLYNKAVHKSQGVVEKELMHTTVKKGRGRAAAPVEDDGLPPPSDAESEPEADEDEGDVTKFQKKPRGGAGGGSRGRASTGGDEGGATKGKRKASTASKATAAKKRK